MVGAIMGGLILEVGWVAYAVLIHVAIDRDADRAHRHAVLNEFVLPQTTALPGFVKGTWLHDGEGTGTCLVVFDSESHARDALDSLTPSGGPPLLACSVHEVELEA
jgi:hypothetical protein